MVTTHWLEVDSKQRSFGCKAQNIPLHHRVLSRISPNAICT